MSTPKPRCGIENATYPGLPCQRPERHVDWHFHMGGSVSLGWPCTKDDPKPQGVWRPGATKGGIA